MKKHKFRRAILVVQILCLIYLSVFSYYNKKAFLVYPSYAALVESGSSLYHTWSTLWGFSFIPGVILTLGFLPVLIACIVGIVKFFKGHKEDKWLLIYSVSSIVMEILLLPGWAVWIETHQV